jgi:hypothetical protein
MSAILASEWIVVGLFISVRRNLRARLQRTLLSVKMPIMLLRYFSTSNLLSWYKVTDVQYDFPHHSRCLIPSLICLYSQ